MREIASTSRCCKTVHSDTKDEDMAAFDTTRTTYGSTGLFGRIGIAFVALTSSVMAWNDARTSKNALNALSDRELADIGLSRANIEDIATGKPVF
jgi:uncharacterized protein YjiS (DUF1127 family)